MEAAGTTPKPAEEMPSASNPGQEGRPGLVTLGDTPGEVEAGRQQGTGKPGAEPSPFDSIYSSIQSCRRLASASAEPRTSRQVEREPAAQEGSFKYVSSHQLQGPQGSRCKCLQDKGPQGSQCKWLQDRKI